LLLGHLARHYYLFGIYPIKQYQRSKRFPDFGKEYPDNFGPGIVLGNKAELEEYLNTFKSELRSLHAILLNVRQIKP